MNKIKTEINVPYKFCENCSLRRIETEEHFTAKFQILNLMMQKLLNICFVCTYLAI